MIYTQPVFDEATADKAMRAAEEVKLPMFVGLLPLRSQRHAEFMHNEVPGIRVPEWLRKRIAEAPDDTEALKIGVEEAQKLAVRVIKPETSALMRYLMRLNVEKGSGRKADIPGYYVGAKTGTAEKVVNGRYSKTKLLTTFTAVLPADHPRYLVTVLLDEPQAAPGTYGFATSGWNAGPTAGKIIARVAPMLGLEPRLDLPPADQLILANMKQAAR